MEQFITKMDKRVKQKSYGEQRPPPFNEDDFIHQIYIES
jgi:hypothetical protein